MNTKSNSIFLKKSKFHCMYTFNNQLEHNILKYFDLIIIKWISFFNLNSKLFLKIKISIK